MMDAAAVATRVQLPSRTNVAGFAIQASICQSQSGGFEFDLLSFIGQKGRHILHPYLRWLNTGMMGMSLPFGGSRRFCHCIHPQNVGSFHPDRALAVLSLLNQTA